MDIVLRAVAAFVFIFILMRVTGRRTLGSMEPFDLIMLILLGDLVQQGITQSDYSVTGIALAAGTIGVLTVIVSFLSFRFRRLRPLLDGEPIVIIKDGKILEQNLRRERMLVEEVAAQARLQQIASLKDVRWGVLERGGQISFIPKEK